MTAFVIRRLMQSVLVMFVMTLIVFFGVNIIGDPVDLLVDPQCTLACLSKAKKALGMHLPLHQQFLVFLGNVAQGDLGDSFVSKTPAVQVILERMPATLELAGSAIVITVVLGIPLGVWAGLKPESLSGRVIMSGSILGFSLPTFWIGLLFILFFAVDLDWLPSSGRGETVAVIGLRLSVLTLDGLTHLVMPATTLSLFFTALVIRLTRSGTRETLLMDYVKFAHAKGVSPRRIVFVHVLKNILIPVLTVLGLELGGLIAFAVVTETVFAWPGMGKLLIDSIGVLDRPVIVAYLILIVFLVVFINLAVDILYSVLDPRVRLQRTVA